MGWDEIGMEGITILYPENEEGGDLDLDIIALHGLNGSPMKTFTHPRTQKQWLRDFLPKDLKRTRVMVFGYNATAAFQGSVAGIRDHARGLLGEVDRVKEGIARNRPVIFVGHSLGGLVIKQALVVASQESRYSHILSSTLGVIFFGTPHQGSALATYGATLARVPSALAIKPTPELLSSLKSGCERLQRLTRDFRGLCERRGWNVVSFYEMRTMTVLWGRLVVEKESAVLAPPGTSLEYENQIPVNETHRGMCRFSSANDKTYKTFIRSVREILYGRDEGVKNEFYIVPHGVNPNFTGRVEIRQQLRDALITDRWMKTELQRRFVLYGMGGAGKTQVCVKFAQDYRELFWGVFWIDASSTETALEGFLAIARACKQNETVDSIKEFLSRTDKWLLIIDNADDPTLDIAKLCPAGNQGSILITTRNPDFRQHGYSGSCKVNEMGSSDAATLLCKSAQLEDIQDLVKIKIAEDVVKKLGYLALAIIQAGAVIRQGLCSLESFCDLYDQQKKELLESGRPPPQSDYQHSVCTTWEISIVKITKISIENEDAVFALELLRLFSFMHFDGISEHIFGRAVVNATDFRDGCFFSRTAAYQMMGHEWDQLKFSRALKILAEFSLITIDGSRHISMHPLVHEWSRERMSREDRRVAWEMTAATLAMSIWFIYRMDDLHHRRTLIAHVDVCLSSPEGRQLLFAEGHNMMERLFMAQKFAVVYREADRDHETFNLESRCLECLKEILDPAHIYILLAMRNVADSLSHLCRFNEALKLQLQRLDIARASTGENSDKCLSAMLDIAGSYCDLGHYEKALEITKSVAATYERKLGDDSFQTARAKADVATCLSHLDRWKEAASIQEAALKTVLKLYPESHPHVLVFMQNLAVFYDASHRRKKARRLKQQTLEAKRLTLGENHPSTISSMSRMVPSGNMRNKKEVLAMRINILNKTRESRGELHIRTLRTKEDLASIFYARGAFNEARAIQENVVEGYREMLGDDHPETVAAIKDLADKKLAAIMSNIVYCWVPARIYSFFSVQAIEFRGVFPIGRESSNIPRVI